MKQYFIFTILVFITWACGEEVNSTKKPGDLGAKVFRKNCILCHGADGKLQSNGAKDLTNSTLSLEERILLINNGRKTMTPFKGILSDKKIEAVAKYSLKFNKDLEIVN